MTSPPEQPKILVITPVRHIPGVAEALEAFAEVTFLEDPTPQEAAAQAVSADAIFTNPNKSKVFIGQDLIQAAPRLKAIATASTGLNHIDRRAAARRGVAVISLTRELDVIERISSTAEHAFALTLAGLRSLVPGHIGVVRDDAWDYEPFIGRQLDHLTVGVVGFGRLGKKYAHYAAAFGARVLVCDPYVTVENPRYRQTDFDTLLRESDIVAVHVHVSDETTDMFDAAAFARCKGDVLLVNTSRGEVFDETALVAFLTANPKAKAAVDVLRDEVKNRRGSPLLSFARHSDQVIVTPHVGGMTREGQGIAYMHAVTMLRRFLEEGPG